ncbi:hypothetical protein D3C77_304310 [compost metagenome]
MKSIFLIPVVLLTFFVWRDYSGEVEDINNTPPSLSGIYYFDEGNKIAVLNEEEDWNLNLQLFDAKSKQLLKKEVIPSNVHKQVVAAYQQDKLVISTYDDKQKLQVNMIDPSGAKTTLTQGELLIPTFLSSDMRVWRDTLFVAGHTVDDDMYVAQIRDGKLTKVILDKGDLLPIRPESIRLLNGIIDQGLLIPMFELSLIDDRTAYISGILDENQLPVVVLKQENETSFDAQDRATLEFAKHFKLNMTKQIGASSDFPSQAKYYNAETEEWGNDVPTPKPIYLAKIYTLNEAETLIVGSSAKDEREGSRLGYIFNNQTGQFSDVTSLVSAISYEDLDHGNVLFYKNVSNDVMYYNQQGLSAGMINVATGSAERIADTEVQQWLNVTVGSISWESFLKYVGSWNALVINWVVWVGITLFSTIGLIVAPKTAQRSREKKLARGVLCQGTIMNMKETGLYVNEHPQVQFTVQFQDEGVMKQVDMKQVISFLAPISIGDLVMISYDRKRHRAIFVNEGEEVGFQQEQMEQIDHAVLEFIEKFGSIGRGRALLLHFKAGEKQYTVPVVQPIGFEYVVGEQARLLIVNGTTRIRSYGRASHRLDTELIQLEGKIIEIDKYSISINNRQLMMMEVAIDEVAGRLRKTNSLFVPVGMPVHEGVTLPVSFRKEDYRKELRLLNAKQGGARVVDVQYSGTLGERPLAHITVDRVGTMYSIEQTIEPVYGIAVGDEIWIAYDEVSREAIIIKYAT